MPKESFKVEVNSAIIKWARETAGWSIDEVSKRLKTSKENYQEIESGKKSPTFQQIKILAHLFKRPISTFFLPQPPEEPAISSSFRVLPKSEAEISKELRLAIRKARYYHSIANELMLNLNMDPTPKIEQVKLDDSPLDIAKKERRESGISIEGQYTFKNAYDGFNTFRHFIESKNILVFQFKFPLKDARGFSLMDTPPYVIVINSEDNILARIFTLFHEYAHLLLGIPELYVEDLTTYTEIERWCDSFASEFLIPEEELRKDELFISFLKTKQLTQEIIENLSRKFKVSKKALLTKLRILNLIGYQEYEEQKAKLEMQEIPEKKAFIILPEKRCIQEKGNKFILTVLESKEKGFITTQDMVEFLSIKLNRLDKLERSLSQR